MNSSKFMTLRGPWLVILVALWGAGSSCGEKEPELPAVKSQTSSELAEESSGSSAEATQAETYSSESMQPSQAMSLPTIIERANFGADIGSDAMKQDVAQCVTDGYFFDRSAGICDEESKASEFDCSQQGLIGALMLSEQEQASLLAHFAEGGQLHGYMIDQCRAARGGIQVYVVQINENNMIVQRHLTFSN